MTKNFLTFLAISFMAIQASFLQAADDDQKIFFVLSGENDTLKVKVPRALLSKESLFSSRWLVEDVLPEIDDEEVEISLRDFDFLKHLKGLRLQYFVQLAQTEDERLVLASLALQGVDTLVDIINLSMSLDLPRLRKLLSHEARRQAEHGGFCEYDNIPFLVGRVPRLFIDEAAILAIEYQRDLDSSGNGDKPLMAVCFEAALAGLYRAELRRKLTGVPRISLDIPLRGPVLPRASNANSAENPFLAGLEQLGQYL